MTPEAFALVDKLSFTGFLVLVVWILYRDIRSERHAQIEANSKAIADLVPVMKDLIVQVERLADTQRQMLGNLPATRPLRILEPQQVEPPTIMRSG